LPTTLNVATSFRNGCFFDPSFGLNKNLSLALSTQSQQLSIFKAQLVAFL